MDEIECPYCKETIDLSDDIADLCQEFEEDYLEVECENCNKIVGTGYWHNRYWKDGEKIDQPTD